MILPNRRYDRQTPSREAKNIYIFCEGARRETRYFNYFKEIDSRINIEVYQLDPTENNSPKGLLEIAISCTDPNQESSRYDVLPNDEVWIVLDIDPDKLDSRTPQITEINEYCSAHSNWHLAQSNPCFEVWLFYHMHELKPEFIGQETCTEWKTKVNESISGGFDCRKHPIMLEAAINNAKNNFNGDLLNPQTGETNLFTLGKVIYEMTGVKLKSLLASE